MISTHAPAGGATSCLDARSGRQEFLLTPLREGRPGIPQGAQPEPQFLLTPLREGRPDEYKKAFMNYVLFLLTPLREGRRSRRQDEFRQLMISTHAPAGGATDTAAFYRRTAVFLLTPLREGRLHIPQCNGVVRRISTHAPAGGATRPSRRRSSAW